MHYLVTAVSVQPHRLKNFPDIGEKTPRREFSAASQYCVLRQKPSAFRQKSLSGMVFQGKIRQADRYERHAR